MINSRNIAASKDDLDGYEIDEGIAILDKALEVADTYAESLG